MKEAVPVFNMDDAETKRRLVAKIRIAKGLWDCELKPHRLTRTLQQNKYYWAGVVGPFCEWLRENYGDSWITPEQAHEVLRDNILSRKQGGKFGLLPPSTTWLNTEEFWEYVEKASAWLAEFCEIVVIPPDLFTIQKEQIKT